MMRVVLQSLQGRKVLPLRVQVLDLLLSVILRSGLRVLLLRQ